MSKKRLIILVSFIIVFALTIILSFLYSKDKYTVSFETGSQDYFMNQYISKNGVIDQPVEPTKEGYVFKEWQLNGEKYDFSNKIDSDLILTAKWVKEEYVFIYFDTKSDYMIEPIKILKGETITELPVAEKEEYEFIGWFLDDILYNNQEINSDTTLIAEYKNETINTSYKIGDKVKIIGNYSNCSNSNYAYNKRAIGWDRTILQIYEGMNYPYLVGNEDGVTGFFKSESIAK